MYWYVPMSGPQLSQVAVCELVIVKVSLKLFT